MRCMCREESRDVVHPCLLLTSPPSPRGLCTQEKVVFVCGVDCSQEFKKANCVTSLCEYCKMERITKDSKKINFKDCSFCSDGKKTCWMMMT